MSPVFNPLRQVATYEATFEVSGAPPLQFAARVRADDALPSISPEEVTVCYAHTGSRWEATGVEIKGAALDRPTPLIVRFTPDTAFDPPDWGSEVPAWALELVPLMEPTGTPG